MKTPDTLFLTLKPDGLYYPGDHISQEIALKHFSGGSIAVTRNTLDEITYVANLHGWKVATEEEDPYAGPRPSEFPTGFTDDDIE